MRGGSLSGRFYLDMVQTVSEKQRIANKEHKCSLCHCIIEKGEKYNSDTMKCDKQIYTLKSHIKCKNILHDLYLDDYDLDSDGFCFVVEVEYDKRIRECITVSFYDKVKFLFEYVYR